MVGPTGRMYAVSPASIALLFTVRACCRCSRCGGAELDHTHETRVDEGPVYVAVHARYRFIYVEVRLERLGRKDKVPHRRKCQ